MTTDRIIMIIPCLWTSLFGLVRRYMPKIIPNKGRTIEQIYPRAIAVVCLSGFKRLPQFVQAMFPTGTGDPHLGHGVVAALFFCAFGDGVSPVSEAPHPGQNLASFFTSLPQLLQKGIFLTLLFCSRLHRS